MLPGEQSVALSKEKIVAQEGSAEFVELCKDRIYQSYFKYGPVKDNYGRKIDPVDAVECLKRCLKKFEDTHNTEYLCDIANYAMYAFEFPKPGEFFRATGSDESAGIAGVSINEIKNFDAGW